MADKKSFKDRVSGYSDQYEAAIKKNARDFQKVAGECIDRKIKTVDKVLEDAYKGGIKIGKDFVEKYNVTVEQVKKTKVKLETGAVEALQGAKEFIEDKVEGAVELASDAKDFVVDKVGNAKDFVVEKAQNTKKAVVNVKDTVGKKAGEVGEATLDKTAKVAGATVAVGKLGRKVVIKGAKTVGKAGEKVYSAVKGTAQKGFEAVVKWFKEKGKSIKDKVINAKDYVADKAVDTKDYVIDKAVDTKDYVIDKAVDTKDYVIDKAVDTKDYVIDKAVNTKDRVVNNAKNTRDYVVDKAETARDKVLDGTAKVIGVSMAVGKLGAKTVGKAGEKVYSATKGTAEKGKKAVTEWFKAKGKDVKDKVTNVKNYVVDKAVDTRDYVLDKAETTGDKVLEGAAKVAGATIATAKAGRDAVVGAKDKVVDGAKDFASTVETRRNVTVLNLARGARDIFSSFCDRLEQGAVSRQERNQQAKEQREAAKAKAEQSKEDQQMEQD